MDMINQAMQIGGGIAATKTDNGAAPASMREAAEEFEAVFLAQILSGMTAGLGGEGPLSTSEDDPFSGMMQDEYARLISRSGGIGVGDAVLREMLKMQEIG